MNSRSPAQRPSRTFSTRRRRIFDQPPAYARQPPAYTARDHAEPQPFRPALPAPTAPYPASNDRREARRSDYTFNYPRAPWEQSEDRQGTAEYNPRRRRRSSIDFAEEQHDFREHDSSLLHPPAREREELRQHLAKRRRLDVDAASAFCPAIKYGHYGQIESGRLKMIMISCDGGEHTDPRSPHMYLGPHNLLRHDKSVYCSSRKSAAIILRHADDMPFLLTELTVVAPSTGFTAPVRHGIVFVSMTLDALTKYTERPITSRERTAAIARRDPSLLGVSWPPSAIGSSPARSSSPEEEGKTAEAIDAVQNHDPSFHTAELQDDMDLPEEEQASDEWREYLAHRLNLAERREGTRWRERRLNRSLPLNDELSPFTEQTRVMADANDDDTESPPRSRLHTIDVPSPRIRHGVRHANADDFDRDSSKVCPDELVTAAQFCMKKEGQQSVTVKFDKEVAGRFILLKVEGEATASNVDVQTVLVRGFAGPRMTPAVQLR